MKLSENFYCVAEVVCEHWYLGTNFSQYCICLDEYDYETEENQGHKSMLLPLTHP